MKLLCSREYLGSAVVAVPSSPPISLRYAAQNRADLGSDSLLQWARREGLAGLALSVPTIESALQR